MSVNFILDALDELSSQLLDKEILFWNLVDNSVKKGVSIQRTDISKIISGKRDISKNLASEILDENNVDQEHFQNYIEDLIKQDDEQFNRNSLVELLPDNPYGVNTDDLNSENVSFYFTQIWFKYLKQCRDTIHRRNSNKPVPIDPLEITERLKKVVKAFKNIDESKTGLTNAKKVKEKIDKTKEFHLFKKIEGNVMDYFSEIRKLFKEEQETNDLVYEQIARKIRHRYLDLKDKSQHEAFNILVDWLMSETNIPDREACEAVMAYFVQSCEVFSK